MRGLYPHFSFHRHHATVMVTARKPASLAGFRATLSTR